VARRRTRCPERINAAPADLDEESTKAVGLTIPPSLLLRADHVGE
jgi:hypothetical protein